MEFRLLGLLEVSGDKGRILIPRGRESQLLALLLVRRNEPIPTDRIVEELWGERAPQNAAKSVHIYVSRLRKALGPDRLETTPGGYRVPVAPDELDIVAFEDLAARGQAALEAGDAEMAQRALSEALALWRGEPLADFAYDAFAQEEQRRLRERRNGVIADYIDAGLALGRASAAIPELERLVAAEPLWERPRGLLMLALYRAGRQADALDLARATRTLFRDELGLEPSAAIRDLELRILNHDPELGAPDVSTRRVEHPPPLALVAAGAVLLIGAVAAALVWTTSGGGGRTLAPVPPDSLAAIDPHTNRVTAVTPIGSSPASVAVGADGVWVTNAGDQTIALVDPTSKQLLERHGLSLIPGQVAAGNGAVWVTTAQEDHGALLEFDPATQTIRARKIPVHSDDLYATPAPNALAVVGNDVWANTFHSQLVRVTANGSTTLHRLGPQYSVDGVAYGAGSLWVASSVHDQVLRVDPQSGRLVQAIPIAAVPGRRVAGPYGIAVGFGSVWVAATLEDSVVRIDPRTNAVLETIPVGPRPTAITTGSGAIWVLDEGDGTVTRIDPRTNHPTRIPVGRDVTGIAAGDGLVWVTVAGGVSSAPAAAAPFTPLPRSNCGPVVTGGGRPNLLIASDLPTFPGGALTPPDAQIGDMRQAILGVLRDHGFRAGRFRVAYQACNDAPASTGVTSESCAANAHMFAAANVSEVIGPYNSSCAKVELPILDTAPHGPIAVVSPSATYVGLTRSGPATAVDEPDRYYPLRTRNFVRLIGPDNAQGAALAQLAQGLGAKSVFVLDDGDPTSEALAAYVNNSAVRLGLHIAGLRHWSLARSRETALAHFAPLAESVATTRPGAVILTGCICSNGPALVIALRRALGPRVPLLGSDNFTAGTDMSQGPSEMLGMYLTNTGPTPSQLPARTQTFLKRVFRGRPVADISSAAAAAVSATEAALAAIASSNGTTTSVTSQLTHENLFDASGDPTHPVITVVRISTNAPPELHSDVRGVVFYRTIVAQPALAQPLTAPG